MKLLTNSTRAQLEIGTEVSRSIDSPTEFARTILRCFERDKDWIEYHAEQLAELAEEQPPRDLELARAAVCRKALRHLRDGYHDKALSALTDFEGAQPAVGDEAVGHEYSIRVAVGSPN